jgi:RNA polymerase sigma-70 factor, ECF subfamily
VLSVSLALRFYERYRGPRTPGDDARLEAALQDFATRGGAAFPDVALDAEVLAGYLGERAPADAPPVAWLGEVPAGDLFLACACVEGLPQALRAFAATFVSQMDVYLRSLRPTPHLVAETTQELLEKLFVGGAGRLPRIRQYAGQSALGGWVRVAAIRTALDLIEAEKAGEPRGDEVEAIARAVVPPGDPEIDLLRASYRDEFMTAFREAMAALPRRERGLLRFTFVERLTPARIAAMYGVHRTTAMRWIDGAREEVLSRTRARMMDRLRLSPSECDAVVALVRSRIDITLGSLFDTSS